ncbi:MAG: hypothetical protein R3C11_03680 [Planctomycetaceae bacterium]
MNRAAAYLQNHYASEDGSLEWVAVRPDSLINEAGAMPLDHCIVSHSQCSV